MTAHTEHQMQLTSLLVKWPKYGESQFNQSFRQEVEAKIMRFHQEHQEGLTDEDLWLMFGKPDYNLIRPRRCDLSKEKRNKQGEVTRPAFLMDSGEKRLNKNNSHIIVWKLDPQNLRSYMGEEQLIEEKNIECDICHSQLFHGVCPVHCKVTA